MRKNILFSVLIANYNNGRFLMEAIDSVRKQTYDNWEIVIVDDGSTDESNELYKLLELDSKIHVYHNKKNKGCAYTKHQCMLHANGAYCGYLDPDDALLPEAIEVTVRALNAHPEAALTMSRHYLCDANLNIVRENRKLELKPGESYFEHHDYQAEVFSGFRKEAYLQMGGLDITCKAGVDADLYFRLEEQGSIVILDDFTYLYRRFDTSITSDNRKMMYWNLIIRHGVCLRRGLPVETYSLEDFKKYVQSAIDLRMSQEAQALNSKAYKLGKWILKPFSLLKSLFC